MSVLTRIRWSFQPTRVVVGLLLFAMAAGTVRADSSPWWNRRWPWRRLVVVSPPQSRLPGTEAAWVEFHLHNSGQADGSRVRVTMASGKPVDFFVMQTGPGDLVRICFALSGRNNKYHVYYGNPEAGPADNAWRPKRGVLLEGWQFRGGAISSYKLTMRTFSKAGEVAGRTFVPNVYLGHNPLGKPSHYCHKYTGWLMCPKSGTYAFSTTSKDASFLQIDGKMVVEWPGRHGPVHDARHTGSVKLERGLHCLTYHHVSIGPNGRAVAAWQPPGSAKPTVIPPQAFAPIARASASDLSRYGAKMQADFTVNGPHETFFKNRYTYRYTFEGRLAGMSTSKTEFKWDFGDGVTAESQKVEHVYLTAGQRAVSLTVQRGGRTSAIRSRIMVTRDWNRVTAPKLDPVNVHAAIVSAYPFDRMSPADLATAVWLLRRGKQRQACLKATASLPDRINEVKPEVAGESLPGVYELLVTDVREPKRAAEVMTKIETRADSVMVKASAAVLAGRAFLDELADLDSAEKCFKRVVGQYGDRTRCRAIRQARIALGDVYLRTARYRQAREMLKQADTVGDAQKRNVRVGSYARAAEDYIRRKEYATAAEYLDRWEWEYPFEKLRGYSTLLRAELLSGRKRHDQVALLVEGFPMVVIEGDKPTDPIDTIYLSIDPKKLPELYKIDATTGRIQSASGTAFPPSPYGMEMGLLAVEAHIQLNHKDRARRVLENLVRLYPDSPMVDRVRKQLKNLRADGRR